MVLSSKPSPLQIDCEVQPVPTPAIDRRLDKSQICWFSCLISGAILGLAAPGCGQWYLAWFALAPLFLFVYSSKNVFQASIRGAFFGLGYHLAYLNWYTAIHPIRWLGFSDWQSLKIVAVCYLFETLHHTFFVLIFAGLAYLIPVKASFLPSREGGKWLIPAFLALPLLWVLCNNKLGNSADLLGVPWAMLEYTQYCQLPIIQIASLIGGVGLEFIIVLVNVVIASVVATNWSRISAKSLEAKTALVSYCQLGIVAFGFLCLYAGGTICLATTRLSPDVSISCLQTNFGKNQRSSILDNQGQAMDLLMHAPAGLCVWPTLPFGFRESKELAFVFSRVAREKHLDLILAGVDRTGAGPSHSAYSINKRGELGKDVYHKRYLVPFAEYRPAFLKLVPRFLAEPMKQFLPEKKEFIPGHDATVLSFDSGKVAPLICFEVISPELAAASVRNGGELLVDFGDRTWFHGTTGWMMGEQMLSMAVMRAVENRRYFVYLIKTGSSVVIEPTGRIVARAPYNEAALLTGKIQFCKQLTLFNWLQNAFLLGKSA